MKRESLTTDAIGIAVGVGMILVAFSRLGNQIPYGAGDLRGEPWFNVLITAVLVAGGLFAGTVGVVRILLGVRTRRP